VTNLGLLLTASGPFFAHSAIKTAPKMPQTLPLDDSDTGFMPIFDGMTLGRWDVDPTYWRAEGGELIGEITAFNLLKQNSFIIWRGGDPKDLELKAKYRVSEFSNSGINYRSVEIRGSHWVLRGPQADRRPKQLHGQNYDEGDRTVLARRGDVIHIATGSDSQVTPRERPKRSRRSSR
jgi:hypothetical protein